MKPQVYESRPEFAGKQEYFWRHDALTDVYFMVCYTQFADKVFRFHLHLGKVKQKNDGRFDWWYWYKPHYMTTQTVKENKQGVAASKEEAMSILEKMCGIENE